MKRLIGALATVAALLGLVAISGPASAAEDTTLISCSENITLRYRYYTAAGTEVPGNEVHAVKVAVAVRGFTPGCDGLIEQVDAAARGYDLGHPSVGNVQVDNVYLYASGGGVRSGPAGVSNSNGAPTTDLIHTYPICVSPFGSGGYFPLVRFTWRYNGVLKEKWSQGWATPNDYATISC